MDRTTTEVLENFIVESSTRASSCGGRLRRVQNTLAHCWRPLRKRPYHRHVIAHLLFPPAMSAATANALRTLPRRATSCSRHRLARAASMSATSSAASSSTEKKLDVEPKDSLPADKMRVLVDLYHESASYITKENLSAAIDNAFIYRPNQRMAGSSAPEQTFPQLQVELAKRRAMPRFAQPPPSRIVPRMNAVSQGYLWSESRSPRQEAAMCALYGVYYRGRPGYDVLMDEEQHKAAEAAARERAAGEAARAKAPQERSKKET